MDDDANTREGLPWVRAQARLVPSGEWRRKLLGRLKASGRPDELTLRVDDEPLGHVITRMEVGGGGFDVDALRTTEVHLADGHRWEIGAEDPGPYPTEETLLGHTKAVAHPIDTRVVSLYESGPDRQLLARASGFGEEPLIDAGDTEYSLTVRGKRAVIARSTTIRRERWGWPRQWLVGTPEPVPLPVVLLAWHLAYGDHSISEPGGY